MTEKSTPPWERLGRWGTVLILVGVIAILAVAGLSLAARARRHQASTYGIVDPTQAVLRVENRTSDFSVRSISLEDAERSVVVQNIQQEIRPGDETVLEIAPETYRVNVLFVEIVQAAAARPEGTLSVVVSISPGKAAILSFQGGNSSPDRPIYIPPELVVK
jgi:hypothetical protein